MRNWIKLDIRVDGDNILREALVNVGEKLEDFTEPLRGAGQLLLDDVRRNFDTEGGYVGGWVPLSASTIADRKRLGFGPGPILHRTGRYKRSFKAVVNKRRMVIDAWGVKYHKYHQSTKPRTKIPRRPTLFFRNETKAEIMRGFQEYVRFKS